MHCKSQQFDTKTVYWYCHTHPHTHTHTLTHQYTILIKTALNKIQYLYNETSLHRDIFGIASKNCWWQNRLIICEEWGNAFDWKAAPCWMSNMSMDRGSLNENADPDQRGLKQSPKIQISVDFSKFHTAYVVDFSKFHTAYVMHSHNLTWKKWHFG